MKVLGIDCGIAITGWAVMNKAKSYKILDYGVIKTKANCKTENRLESLYNDLISLVDEFKPKQAAVESLFYFRNQKTVINVAQARGVILLALEMKGIKVFHYTPLQVKQAITGYGKATKLQVQKMVKSILKLKKMPRPDDAADALAISICHINTMRL